VSTQYQYADVGVNIDARLREIGEKLLLSADFDVSTLSQHEKAVKRRSAAPINKLLRRGAESPPPHG
jgi:hypothetical protein